jgi:hypothetical protein
MKLAFCSMVLVACGLTGMANAADLEPAGTPNWYVNVTALALNRSTPDGGAIIASNPGGVPFLSADDLDFDMGPGIDASIGFNAFDNEWFEARVMYSKFEGENSFVSPGAFIGVGFTGPGGTNFESDFSTTFSSAELNWRHSINDQLTVLAGLRALEVKDSFGTVLNNNVATGLYDGKNKLYGAQIGAQMSFLDDSSPFQLMLSGKVGAYANRSSAGIREFQGNNFIGSFESGTDTKTSFVAEIGLTAGYQLSESLTLTAGYEAVWLDSLALASNAASESMLNPSLLSNSIFRDDLWLHGASIGLQISY